MGNRAAVKKDKKRKGRQKTQRKERENASRFTKKQRAENDAQRALAKKIKDSVKRAENAASRVQEAADTATKTEKLAEETRAATQAAGRDGVTDRILILEDRSYEPTLHPGRGGPLMYEIYPGLFGQAIWMETYQQIWINHVEPVIPAWGKAIVDKFLDHLSHRCRIVHAQYGELYIKLYEKAWVNEMVNLTDPHDGSVMRTDKWRPPNKSDDEPHDGEGGKPEHIDL